ncbi:hypothetical protein R69927_06651 [Paraburkholderia domus]|uniref:Uncharacterized protein n=1 Tax=Paraburkholderia domus TaxID=2793075 RepID=A0A9N8QZP7_9BURK|nr:hypothetical protein R70006_04295 [Paraburkholderia domus]CAE6845441.1 hypothetical protein R75483_07347 [Paraburkholderia domus]CAE6891304.1 hypothetical protein R70211_02731 [Paraburkholderia domus]CAE6891661.1 hypothetical protein R75471_02412 [Paraburkholderia domus]CAE6901778.1 hypothetical protein R70199_03739 [Paraburkholderia domus]
MPQATTITRHGDEQRRYRGNRKTENGSEVMNAPPHPRGGHSSYSGRYPGWRKRRFPFPGEWFLAQWLYADAALRVDIEAGSAAPGNQPGTAFRLPLRGQHRLTRSIAGGAPVSRLTACARARTRAPKVRASLGREPRPVKEARAAAGAFRPADAACRVLSYARVWCPHMRSHVQLNGKQAALAALNLCCPRNGTRPAVLAHRACVFDATV